VAEVERIDVIIQAVDEATPALLPARAAVTTGGEGHGG
jgi:hypothetical protein